MQNKFVRILRSNPVLGPWIGKSRCAAPLRWLYALTQLVALRRQTEDLRRQTEDLRRQTEDLRRQTEVLLKATETPFSIEVHFQALLPRAESRIETDAKNLSIMERETQFYTYFSELGGEYAQEVLRQQHECYLNYIPRGNKLKFLDIGCGSGELLAFLAKHGIPAMGIDLEEKEVERARRAGLNAVQANAETFLNQSNEAYSGISMIQVIEHIPNEAIVKLLGAAVKRLIPGGILLIETLNLRHPHAFNNFYIDPTHINPMPHDYLGFLMEWAGLEDIKLLYSLPAWMHGVHNQDTSRIYMNYTLIGKKPFAD